MKKILHTLAFALTAISSYAADLYTTTPSAAWQHQQLKPIKRITEINITVDTAATLQRVKGVGGCFNEVL